MTYLDQLKADHAALTQMLQHQEQNTPEPMGPGVRIIHEMYILILRDALKMLSTLIEFLAPK